MKCFSTSDENWRCVIVESIYLKPYTFILTNSPTRNLAHNLKTKKKKNYLRTLLLCVTSFQVCQYLNIYVIVSVVTNSHETSR